ncbi:MAG TPA: hypothetical protein VM103_00530 [Candidatus Paceibacterota bacterium]|nr:hypothetical protein [Candidatus Paceibacterota bacterium]
MPHLLSLTGPGGSRKTTIAERMLRRMPRTYMVESYTTRTRRESDLPGEYCYAPSDLFETMQKEGVFLWAELHLEKYYGTRTGSIDEVFMRKWDTVGIMILIPKVIPVLRERLASIGKLKHHVPVFIVPPPEDVLRARLLKRGDSPEDTERRIQAAVSWEQEARASGIPYHFISNDGDLEYAIGKIVCLVC